MVNIQLAQRYAKAIFALAKESSKTEKVIAELRELLKTFEQDTEIGHYFSSPLISPDKREAVLKKALKDSKASEEVASFLLLLARNNRMSLFSSIVRAFEEQSDEAHGVTRGIVESSIALSPDERKDVEGIVKKVTKKEVILSYKTNPKIIGGLTAKVGSYTFDDSIRSHLRRMNEDLKRRTV